jgi:hypothetical protein
LSRRLRQIVTPLAAILGVQSWLLILHGDWGHTAHFRLLLISLAAAAIPPVRRLIWKPLARLRRPSPLVGWAMTASVTIASALLLGRYAVTSGRDLFPSMHDEFQFLLQARMIAAGRLWMPGHPLVDFFDTFYVLIQPKYAPQSFPGAAIFFVPAIWLHVAPWMWAVGLTGITIGLFYRLIVELIDGLAALLGVILLGSLSLLHYVSTIVLAQTPAVLLGLAAIYCYLRFRRRRTAWRGLALGLLAGWMLITRPADALVFGLPMAVDFFLDIFRKPKVAAIQPWAVPVSAILAGVAPFVALQLIVNVNVTGQWLTTPFALYNQRDQPGLGYGFHPPDHPSNPITRVPQKRRYYRTSVAVYFADQTPAGMWKSLTTLRLPTAIGVDLPQPMLAALLPIGILAWGRRRAWLLGAALPLFFALYAPYPLFATHYCIIAAPAVILSVLLAPKAISLAYPRLHRSAWTALAVFTVGLPIAGPADTYAMKSALAFHNQALKKANDFQAGLIALGKPAVMLFRRSGELSLEAEPVYNLDVAWPDDAKVIRAHDRGRENWRIFQYYARHGPDRAFYRFDEGHPDRPPVYLGMASDLASSNAGH